jgi:acetyltransferase-like isoleucine patch superfamily enzyme
MTIPKGRRQMDKNRIFGMINKHYGFFKFFSNIYYGISLKNRFKAKGSKVSVGVSFIKGLKIINYGRNNEIIIGDLVRIKNSKIIFQGDNNKIIINDQSYLRDVELCTEDSGNEISIGKYTNLCGKAHLAAIEGTKITIGDNCLFSSNLEFRTGDSHSILNMNGERINPSKDIVIEDHVWIGTKVTCLKGVRVSRDSIVAATTTLCKEYDEPNVVIGGVPGKIIKRDVNWSHDRI